jgi:hypothetical protein
MAVSGPYTSARFKLSAEFTLAAGEKIVFDDVVAMSATFALNTIPTASLVVAVGTRVDGSGTVKKATIHDAKKRLKTRDKVKVTLEIIAGDGNTKFLRAGSYVVFEGFYVGIGYQRSVNQANYVLHLVHWLDDLNNSSAINGNWFPGVPFDYAQQSLFDAKDQLGSGVIAPGLGNELATDENMGIDLWLSVIREIFLRLSKWSSGSVQSRTPPEGDVTLRNDAAKDALIRMPGAGAKYYKPLGLAVGKISDFNVSNSVTAYFDKSIGESFAQNSFWAKLIGSYAPDFLFAISPAVSWALPIPFCGGIRWAAGDPVITASEYSYASFSANMSQMIESVDVYFSVDSPTRVDTEEGTAPSPKLSFYRSCASFPTTLTPENVRGLKLFKSPPPWAVNLSPASLTGGQSGGNPGLAFDPGKGNNEMPTNVVNNEQLREQIQPVMQNFAKHWYFTELLQQRYGELSGPLRFDIAPGSVVKIETPIRDRAHEASPADNLYATVMSVSFAINAERATAGTSFAIANTKTDDEEKSDVYSTVTPPLYKTKWSSGPLAERF